MMPFKRSLLIHALGWICGTILVLLYPDQKQVQEQYISIVPNNIDIQQNQASDETIATINHKPIIKLADPIPFENRSGPFVINDLNRIYNRSKDHVAIGLATRVRVLCWVMTSPDNYKSKAQAVKETWGRRCHIVLYMSSIAVPEFPVIGLNVPEGRKNLWLKTRAAWKYVYDNHYNDADWFIKADDDSFLLVENLRLYLDQYDTTDGHYFGFYVAFKKFHSGGGGYVFSKKTLAEFYKLLSDPKKCAEKSDAEDVETAACLRAAGIKAVGAFDPEQNSLFHSTMFFRHWLRKVEGHYKCCSKHIISLHHLQPHDIRMLFYFFYKVRIHGVVKDDQ